MQAVGRGHRQYLTRVSRQEEEEEEGNDRDRRWKKRGQATAGELSFLVPVNTISSSKQVSGIHSGRGHRDGLSRWLLKI